MCHSIDLLLFCLFQMSNSSLSENISINNDPDTPPNPLTPPPSPQSPNEKPITPLEMNNSSNESCPNENENENDIDNETQNGPKNIVADGETVRKKLPLSNIPVNIRSIDLIVFISR